ncbi:DUF4124 domain-containing protein [Gammaproteobacteria bacterium]
MHFIISLVMMTLVMALGEGVAMAGKLYKWVDANGQSHYTDRIPSDAAGLGYGEFGEEGTKSREVPRAKTEQEIAREQEEKRLRAEKQRLIAEEKARNETLLRTYQSEDDILLTRDGQLKAVDVHIRVAQSNVSRLKDKLANLLGQAADRERTGQVVPTMIQKGLDDSRVALEDTYAVIVNRENEKNQIREKYAKELIRFRELKNIKAPAQERIERSVAIENAIECPDKTSCNLLWQKAAAFVIKHSNTPLALKGDRIIMTQLPSRDEEISVSLSQVLAKNGLVSIFLDLQCRDSTRGKESCNGAKGAAILKDFRSEFADVAKATPDRNPRP